MFKGRRTCCALGVLLLFGCLANHAGASGSLATTTLLSVAPGSSVSSGSAFTLTATVLNGGQKVHPGQVLFCEATAPVCSTVNALATAQLTAAGAATAALKLPAGQHRLVAFFVGTNTYASSFSTPHSLTVNANGKIATTTTLASDNISGSYKITATVTSNGSSAATGPLTFVNTQTGNSVATQDLNLSSSITVSPTPIIRYDAAQCICPFRAVVADFRTRGVADVVTAPNGVGVHILWNDGSGNLTEQKTLLPDVVPDAIGAGDINNDGHPDLVVVSFGAVITLLGNGQGGFTPGPTLPESTASSWTAQAIVADFTGDGILDLLTIGNVGFPSVLLRGAGDGSFTALGQPPVGAPAIVGDFNGDGILDLASSGARNGIIIQLGNGDGTSQYSISTSGYKAGPLAATDVNRDGKLDLIISADPYYVGSTLLAVALGRGDGHFDKGPSYPVTVNQAGDPLLSISVGDLNGDGTADVAVLATSNTLYNYPLTFLLGHGDGTFSYAGTSVTSSPFPLLLANFTGNGVLGAPSVLGATDAVLNFQPASTTQTSSALIGAPLQAQYEGDNTHAASSSAVFSSLVTPVDFTQGFVNAASQLVLHGAQLKGNVLRLTDGGTSERSSAFFAARLPVEAFDCSFDFQLKGINSPTPDADGFAFVITNTGPNALGAAGGGLGYGPSSTSAPGPNIPASLAITFDLHKNAWDGSNAIGEVTKGTSPTNPDLVLKLTNVDLHSGHPFHVSLSYNSQAPQYPVSPKLLLLTLTDQTTGQSFSHQFPVDIATLVGGTTAYVGFTGATGGLTAVQDITGWTFTSDTSSVNTLLDFPSFNDPSQFTINGGATIANGVLELTNGLTFAKSSIYYNTKVPSDIFTADFDFQMSPGEGDGFTFLLQNQGIAALGSAGGGLGYSQDFPGRPGNRIKQSGAIKFDVHNNDGEGNNSTGYYVDGASPTVPSISLGGTGMDLRSGHLFHARITFNRYVENGFSETITDLSTYASFVTLLSTDDLVFVTGGDAFAGFTAGTGAVANSITIFNWTMTGPF